MTDSITPKDRKHSWPKEGDEGYRRLSGVDTSDGNDRTERVCTHCSMVKITVHPPHGDPWREWRTKDGKVWRGEATPPCLPVKVVA